MQRVTQSSAYRAQQMNNRKTPILTYHTSIWSPHWERPRLNFAEIFDVKNHQDTGLSYGIVCVILCLAVLVEFRVATNGRTDRQTDRQTRDDSIYRASIRPRVKNESTS